MLFAYTRNIDEQIIVKPEKSIRKINIFSTAAWKQRAQSPII